MLNENAVYEEIADESTLEGDSLDEFFEYHRNVKNEKAIDPTDLD